MTYLKVRCNHFYWWLLSPKLEALGGDTADEVSAGIAHLKRTSIDLYLDTTNSVKERLDDTI